MDLIIWFDSDNTLVSFELCYDKQTHEKALRWSSSGIEHSSVDSGENSPGKYKSTPVLRESRHFDVLRVQDLFAKESTGLPHEITEFVTTELSKFG